MPDIVLAALPLISNVQLVPIRAATGAAAAAAALLPLLTQAMEPQLGVQYNLWKSLLRSALDADVWGQALEAAEFYEQLHLHLRPDKLQGLSPLLSKRKLTLLQKLRYCIGLRISALQTIGDQDGPTLRLQDAKQLLPLLENLFESDATIEFPIDVSTVSDVEEDLAEFHKKRSGSLERSHNKHYKMLSGTTVVITVQKIGLKDAKVYKQPRMVISLVDGLGKFVEKPKEVAVSNQRQGKHIIFEEKVHLQTPFELFQGDYALFFEFKHYKEEKQKLSTRCFSFMDYDEIHLGEPTALELYKKPTDFLHKRVRLHTVKPLYTHVVVDLVQPLNP